MTSSDKFSKNSRTLGRNCQINKELTTFCNKWKNLGKIIGNELQNLAVYFLYSAHNYEPKILRLTVRNDIFIMEKKISNKDSPI